MSDRNAEPDKFKPTIYSSDGLLINSPYPFLGGTVSQPDWNIRTSDSPLQSTTKRRRQSQQSGDQAKHRRTRTGCYTCRARRVKCDEQQPVCERCKKGSRECSYPQNATGAKSGRSAKLEGRRVSEEDSEASAEEDDTMDDGGETMLSSPQLSEEPADRSSASADRLDAIAEGSAPEVPIPVSIDQPPPGPLQQPIGKSSSPPIKDSSLPLSSSGIATNQSLDFSAPITSFSRGSRPWANQSQELQFYLEYHQSHLTYHHYFFKHDANDFVHTDLIHLALGYEPLLYAVVGFAAYHLTTQKQNGKIQHFLSYYQQSVSLLLKHLSDGYAHNDATILTILQLAAFEVCFSICKESLADFSQEYLGDWANLLGHRKAAYAMLVELYTLDTIMETEVRRKILVWYFRFDLLAGFMSGNKTVLGREWFLAYQSYHQVQIQDSPNNIDYLIECEYARFRMLAMDITTLFAKVHRAAITMKDFIRDNKLISDRIRAWKSRLNPLLMDTRYLVTSFEGARARGSEDIVDPYMKGGLYQGPLWTINFMLVDYYALEITHEYQTALLLSQTPSPELLHSALEICRIFESIEYWPGSPQGAILPAQSSLGMASLFLPKDDRYIMWCRRKLATVERLGFTYPMTFRIKMAEFWDIPDIRQWWLPNNENYPRIIRSIRSFVDERTSKARDQTSEDVQSIKGLFLSLGIEDSTQSSPEHG